MSNFGQLADRCAHATGPDRLLDADIACATRFPHLRPARPDDFDGKYGYAPGSLKVDTGFLTAYSYTRSLDDAMTLVPEGWRFEVTTTGFKPGASIITDRGTFINGGGAYAATPALALCAAALRARAAMATELSE